LLHAVAYSRIIDYTKLEPVAAAEIGELKYFYLNEYLQQVNKAPGAVMILELLKADKLID
jgi:hypothetical protein